MSIQAVMEGIEARLETISGLRVSAISPGQISPPAAIVGIPPVSNYLEAFQRGKYSLEPTVTILTSTSWNRTGQLELAQYANITGPKSVPAAIAGDPTLGGAAEACQVVSFEPLGIEDVGVIGYFGGVFSLRCMAKEVV